MLNFVGLRLGLGGYRLEQLRRQRASFVVEAGKRSAPLPRLSTLHLDVRLLRQLIANELTSCGISSRFFDPDDAGGWLQVSLKPVRYFAKTAAKRSAQLAQVDATDVSKVASRLSELWQVLCP